MPMSESADRYFELNDNVGVTADGNPEPLNEIGITVSVPSMAGNDVVDVPQGVRIVPAADLKEGAAARLIPGTRIVHARDPRVVNVLAAHQALHEVDPPTKKAVTDAKKTTQDAAEEAGTHTEGEE